MERLLKEIEASLARMTPVQRERTARALQGLVSASRDMRDLELSKGATMAAINTLVIGAAQGHGLSHHLGEAKRLAPRYGKYVTALVATLS